MKPPVTDEAPLAHAVNEELTIVLNAAKLIKRRLPADSPAADPLQDLEAATARACTVCLAATRSKGVVATARRVK